MNNYKTKILNYIKKFFNFIEDDIFIFNKISKKDKIILLMRADLIGDYVISKDIFRLIKETKFKNYKIIFCGNISLKDFILDFDKDYIDGYIPINLKKLTEEKYKKEIFKKINKYKYNFVINYMPIRNGYSEYIIQNITSGEKVGIKGFNLNFTDEVKSKFDNFYDILFECENNSYDGCTVELLEKLTNQKDLEYKHHFLLNEEIEKEITNKFNFPYSILFPSASYESKRLPFDKFLEIAKHLYENHNIKSILCGAPNDLEIIKNFNIDLPYINNQIGNFKLSELPYLFKNAKIICTNDTCAMHIAKCVNKNILVFSNVQIVSAEYLKNYRIINGKQFYTINTSGFNFIYPEENITEIINGQKPTINKSLSTINLENAYQNIDNIIHKKL